MAETKEDTTQPGPGDPGYYSPPDPPKVAEPQNPPPPQAAAATTTSTPEPPAEAAESVDYDDMTVAELKDLAHRRGVEIHSDMLKDDIIKALKKADKK